MDKLYKRSFSAMNTVMSIQLYKPDSLELFKEIEEYIKYLESLWSVTIPGSEIFNINSDTRHENQVLLSDQTANIIKFSLQMAQLTHGAFDPTIYPIVKKWGFTTDQYHILTKETLLEIMPYIGYEKLIINDNVLTIPLHMQLDLGGVGKGYSVDKIIDKLINKGITSALINFGGNIYAIGCKQDSRKWRIGIKAPYEEHNLGYLDICDCSVVTSGGYERYFINNGKTFCHIMDTKTGLPVENNLLSVTIVASKSKICDALSTAIYTMGLEKAINYWKSDQLNFDMILVTKNNSLYITKNIKDNFKLSPLFEDMIIYDIP